MAKLTLLDMVRNILNAMDSDDVYTINETPEALQVAEIVKETYYQIISTVDIPENKTLLRLEALGDTEHPNYLKMQDGIKKIYTIRYNKRKSGDTKDKYDYVEYKEPELFLRDSQSLDNSLSDVEEVVDFSGVSLFIWSDRAPSYYTTFDDKYIVFDSYNSNVDTTLKNSKVSCIGETIPDFTLSDDYVAELDDDVFPLLLAEAKSMCFNTLRQAPNSLIERRAREQRVRWQNDKHRIKDKTTGYLDFGWK